MLDMLQAWHIWEFLHGVKRRAALATSLGIIDVEPFYIKISYWNSLPEINSDLVPDT
jgi:hypothetical protein